MEKVFHEMSTGLTGGLQPVELRRLSKLSPLRATLSLIQTFSTIVLLVAVALRWTHPAITALVLFCMAGQQHALAILTHQAVHFRMYKVRWQNDLAGRLTGYPLSLAILVQRSVHRLHHNYLYSASDPELATMAGYPRGRFYLVRKILKDLCGITAVQNYFFLFGSRAKVKKSGLPAPAPASKDETSPMLRVAALRDKKLALAFHFVLFFGMLAAGHLRDYLLLWLLPLTTLFPLLLRLRGIAEHGAVPDTTVLLRATRTTLASPLVCWFLFPHQMNYHIEHHLYPSIPHYNLPECHRMLVEKGVLANAEVARSTAEVLRKVFQPAA